MVVAKKANEKKKLFNQSSLGPCIYSPRFEAVEGKRDKNV